MSLLELKSKFCKLDADHRLYGIDIPVIGLTGGIATGKSTVAQALQTRNAPLIDADALVKEIYKLETTLELLKKIAPQSLSQNKEVNFKILRQLFFENPSIKEALEAHIYRLLPQAFSEKMGEFKDAALVVYDVPLLFEKRLQDQMDLTVLVYAPKETQIQRLIDRDHIDQALAETIIANQMPIDEKLKLADYVIKNTQDINHLQSEVSSFLEKVLA